MKNAFLATITLLMFFAAACKKTKTDPVPVIDNSAFDISKATLLKQGNFTGTPGHAVSGTVKLYDYNGNKYLHLEPFSTVGGPDLRVYLSTNTNATLFVSAGVLKSNNATQTYVINNPPDFTQYKNVLIWCQQFSVLFGSAVLN